MLTLLSAYREHGWHAVDAATYEQLWNQYGGSVATHPEFVARLSALAKAPVRYLACGPAAAPTGAVAVWGRHLALSRKLLKRWNKRDLFDLGNAEIILPMAAETRVALRHRGQFLGAPRIEALTDARPQADDLALAREPEEYSRKFRYNQRREWRLLEESGGVLTPVQELSPAQLAEIYRDLFQRRWGFAAAGAPHLEQVFTLLREWMVGSVMFRDGAPVAIQILYRVESPQWVSVEYINGGVDPEQKDFSPGSVLSFLNTQAEWDYARSQGKALRYSFGRFDQEYKERWCHRVPAYEVGRW
ncbi:GNAT family N-acetyltransferase [Isoalcanivorax beigongshangi]|uniref:GNAT family N-acetyltransferase n=1 Tax=Isoalcanivorax beigongshangi TaxID=3238810 RepID=A0ABV4ADF0_9GAMM